MEELSLLVIEDEAILAMTLCDRLEAEGYRVVGVASNGPRALDLFQRNPVDLVLCDVHIRGDYDGIETIRRMQALRPVPVIYLTAFTDGPTVERAKQTGPAAYLVKPYDLTALRIAIEVAVHNFHQPTAVPAPAAPPEREPLIRFGADGVFLKQGHQFIKLYLPDVLILEADDIYTTFVTTAKKHALRLPLTTVLDRLAHPALVRVHRSYAVNLHRVDGFDDQELRVDGRVVPMGRRYREGFLKRLQEG
jgi:DNA-binding LytR/AlgR family response regulator